MTKEKILEMVDAAVAELEKEFGTDDGFDIEMVTSKVMQMFNYDLDNEEDYILVCDYLWPIED